MQQSSSIQIIAFPFTQCARHFLMVAFYRPTSTRFKILIEEKAFPSDQVGPREKERGCYCGVATFSMPTSASPTLKYAVESQLKLHGLSPADALVTVRPRSGEQTLRTEDIVATIEREGDTLALVLFSGVQYYTGQFFDIQAIAGVRSTSQRVAGGCS